MRKLFLAIRNVLIYCVNLAVSLGCDLFDNVTMVKHSIYSSNPTSDLRSSPDAIRRYHSLTLAAR